MKENEIKTALLNEVIEMIKGNIKSGRLGEYEYRNNVYTRGLIKQVQSLLPKEEAKDWSKSSDEELKKEAEKLIGKTIVCLVDNKPHVVKQHYNNDPNNTHSDGSIWMDSETLIGSTNEQMGIQVYCRESNQWAEIIPDSQIKEPVKSEPTQEIKVGQDVWLSKQGGFTHTVLSIDGDEAWIKRNHDGYSMVVKVYQIYNYIESDPLQKTQEEMDREKAREILNKWGLLDSEGKGNPEVVCAVLEAVGVKSGRKTKQD